MLVKKFKKYGEKIMYRFDLQKLNVSSKCICRECLYYKKCLNVIFFGISLRDLCNQRNNSNMLRYISCSSRAIRALKEYVI